MEFIQLIEDGGDCANTFVASANKIRVAEIKALLAMGQDLRMIVKIDRKAHV